MQNHAIKEYFINQLQRFLCALLQMHSFAFIHIMFVTRAVLCSAAKVKGYLGLLGCGTGASVNHEHSQATPPTTAAHSRSDSFQFQFTIRKESDERNSQYRGTHIKASFLSKQTGQGLPLKPVERNVLVMLSIMITGGYKVCILLL